MANERNNLMMDQGRATLADTVARTQIAQNEDTRAADKHPLTLEQLRLGNTATDLGNQKKQFDLGVDQALGTDFYVGKAKGDEEDKDFKKFKDSLSAVRDLGAMVSQAPKGQRKAAAKSLFDRARLPQMSQIIDTLEEDDLPAFFDGLSKKMNEMAPKYAIEGLRQSGQTERNTDSIESRERIAAEANASRERIAQLRAATSQLVAKARASKDPDAIKNSNIVAQYTENATRALLAGDLKGATFWDNRAREAAQNIKFKTPTPKSNKEKSLYDDKGNLIIREVTSESPATGGSKPADDDTSGFTVKAR